MSMANFPLCNQPSPLTVANGSTPTFVFTSNGSQIQSITANGQQLQLTDNYNGTFSCTLPPVTQNVTLKCVFISTV